MRVSAARPKIATDHLIKGRLVKRKNEAEPQTNKIARIILETILSIFTLNISFFVIIADYQLQINSGSRTLLFCNHIGFKSVSQKF